MSLAISVTCLRVVVRRGCALLDPGEISTRLTTSNGAMVVLMLCQRGNELTKSTTEEAVGAQLRNQRVNAMAQAFIDEARANATIEILR